MLCDEDEIHQLSLLHLCSLMHLKTFLETNTSEGRAVAETVSCQLLTTAARVRARARSCGICAKYISSEYFFPLPFIPRITPVIIIHHQGLVQ
jgi:hypothetical protein